MSIDRYCYVIPNPNSPSGWAYMRAHGIRQFDTGA